MRVGARSLVQQGPLSPSLAVCVHACVRVCVSGQRIAPRLTLQRVSELSVADDTTTLTGSLMVCTMYRNSMKITKFSVVGWCTSSSMTTPGKPQCSICFALAASSTFTCEASVWRRMIRTSALIACPVVITFTLVVAS